MNILYIFYYFTEFTIDFLINFYIIRTIPHINPFYSIMRGQSIRKRHASADKPLNCGAKGINRGFLVHNNFLRFNTRMPQNLFSQYFCKDLCVKRINSCFKPTIPIFI